MKNRLRKILNIQEGEERLVSLLALYSFFMGAAISFFYTSTTALFLYNFDRDKLPLAFIAGGLLVYLLSGVNSTIQKKIKFSNYLYFSIAFLFVSVAVLLFSYHLLSAVWLIFLLFVWIRVFPFIHGIALWGIAQKLFNLRQGKRLFGIISTGEVIASIAASFSIPLLLRFMTPEDLIYLVLATLLISLAVMHVIVRRYNDDLSLIVVPKRYQQQSKKSFKEIYQNKYYLLIFVMAFLPLFGMYYVDYVFFSQTKVAFPDKEVLAGFLGLFIGFSAITEFILKSFVVGRLIDKYGLKVGLSILPLSLLFSFLIGSAVGTLYGAASLFFSFIAMGRLFMRAVRTSVNDPAFQILFQPLPADERIAFQGQVEGQPKSMGHMAAGFTLLALSALSAMNLVHFAYIFVGVLLLWVKFAFDTYKEYRNSVQSSLEEGVSGQDSSALNGADVIVGRIRNAGKDDINDLIKLLERVEPCKADKLLIDVFEEAPPATKEAMLRFFKQEEIIPAKRVVEKFMEEENSDVSQMTVLDTMVTLKKARESGIEELMKMAHSEKSKVRYRAAAQLGYSRSYRSGKALIDLMQDENPEVRRKAIAGASDSRSYEMWGAVITNLADSAYAHTASRALLSIGSPVVPELERAFIKLEHKPEAQVRIIRLYADIGGRRVITILRNMMNYHRRDLRVQVYLSLQRLGYQATAQEAPVIRDEIMQTVETIVWLAAAAVETRGEEAAGELMDALENEIVQKRDYITILLSLLHDPKVIAHIRESLKSGSAESRAYVIEILDMTVAPELKEILLPLFDQLSFEELVDAYKQQFPQQVTGRMERLYEIINFDQTQLHAWTRACALETYALEGRSDAAMAIGANVLHPDIFISETACRLLRLSAPGLFDDILSRHPKETAVKLRALSEIIFSRMMKVRLLKTVSWLSPLPEFVITDLAREAEELYRKDRQQLIEVYDPDTFVVVLRGGAVNQRGEKVQAGALVAHPFVRQDAGRWKAEGDVTLLSLSSQRLYELMAGDVPTTARIVSALFDDSIIEEAAA